MKDKKKILFCVVGVIVLLLLVSVISIPIVKADSGFDSSWDSGGSSFSSSSSGSSSSDSGDIIFLIYLLIEHPILLVFVIIGVAISYFAQKNKSKKIIEDALNSKLELLDVSEFSDEKKLEIEAFNIYKELQYAWMNFDYDTIRKLTTDEMYNMYSMQLDTLKVKNQKNLMSNITYLQSRIIDKHEENNQDTISMEMTVSCYDFLIDTKTNKVVRGNPTKLNVYTYELTFVKTKDSKQIENCPQCGAPVEANNSGVCKYCKSTLISNDYTLILSKKEMKQQR